MMKQVGLLLIFACLLFVSCNGDSNNKNAKAEQEMKQRQALFDGIMEIHDEVMPYIDPIRTSKKNIKTQMDQDGQENQPDLQKAYDLLETADVEMFKWMRQFESPSDETPHNEAIKYLEGQKESVKLMRDLMLKNIAGAEKIMNTEIISR